MCYMYKQGNRISMLSGEDLAQGVFTAACFEPPGFDPTQGCPFLFEQVECHVP